MMSKCTVLVPEEELDKVLDALRKHGHIWSFEGEIREYGPYENYVVLEVKTPDEMYSNEELN